MARNSPTTRPSTRASAKIGPPSQWMRGADTASTGDMAKSTTLRIVCRTELMMTLPPGAPTTMKGAPSRSRMVGTMPVVRALPGAIELARPGTGSASFIELFQTKPRPGVTTPAPVPSVCVSETALPASS